MKYVVYLLALVYLAGCGLAESAEKANLLVQESNDIQLKLLEESRQMSELTKKMAQGVHDQSLAISLESMLKPENTVILDPPFRMIPYARAFGAEATTTELIEIADILYKEAKFGDDGETRIRQVSLVALTALAGMAPQAKMEAILKEQVEAAGLYEEAAYVFSAGRYNFIRDYLLLLQLESSSFLNLFQLKDAVEQFEAIKFLARSPLVDLFKIQIESLDVDVAIDPTELPALGKKAVRHFQKKMSPAIYQSPQAQALLKKFEASYRP
jgi:hypothetical protein